MFFLVIANLYWAVLTAQSEIDAIKYREVLWGAEKKNVISEYLQLSLLEASVFWPIYESYERTRRSLASSYAIMISEFTKSYPSMSEKELDRYAKKFLLYEKQFSQLHRTYYLRLREPIGSLKATKFIQIETHIQNTLTWDVQTRIALIDTLEPHVFSRGKD